MRYELFDHGTTTSLEYASDAQAAERIWSQPQHAHCVIFRVDGLGRRFQLDPRRFAHVSQAARSGDVNLRAGAAWAHEHPASAVGA